MNFEELKQAILDEAEGIRNTKELADFRVRHLGKKGKLAEILTELKNLSIGEKKEAGKQLNELKVEVEKIIETKNYQLKTINSQKKRLDITAPAIKAPYGHLHPRTLALRKVESIFQSLGFSVVDGPEVETDWYNFEALNFPKDHPARDMQDTFWLKQTAQGGLFARSNSHGEFDLGLKNSLLLRTHTSPVQVRFMEKNNPPLRIIVPGRVFRHEAIDASHESQFYQVEGLMVDKHISAAHFKAIIEEFFKRFYDKKVPIRLRPSFFPFTEPSFELDMSCVFCGGKGCKVCGQAGWSEIGGAGMVNQAVFESAGYIRNDWQGFAFGLGFERMVMMKYKIDDIRLLNSGDLRFLSQF